MTRTRLRHYSRYTQQALVLFGGLIRTARIEQKISMQMLAERAGISRDLLYRIEKGDPRCEIGVAFELATLLNLPLFDAEPGQLQQHVQLMNRHLQLLPKAVHTDRMELHDDF